MTLKCNLDQQPNLTVQTQDRQQKTLTSFQQTVTLFSFLGFIAFLEQSGSRIPEAWS